MTTRRRACRRLLQFYDGRDFLEWFVCHAPWGSEHDHVGSNTEWTDSVENSMPYVRKLPMPAEFKVILDGNGDLFFDQRVAIYDGKQVPLEGMT